VKRPNSLDLNFGPISLVGEQSIKSPGLRVLLRLVSGEEMHLILANLLWRHLQERAEKIPGDKKHVESMLSQSHYVAQFNTAHKLLSIAR
jgi:hypothetical protein